MQTQFNVIVAALVGVTLTLATAQSHTATRLRVEYLERPLGVDVAAPRFSWARTHPGKGEAQTR